MPNPAPHGTCALPGRRRQLSSARPLRAQTSMRLGALSVDQRLPGVKPRRLELYRLNHILRHRTAPLVLSPQHQPPDPKVRMAVPQAPAPSDAPHPPGTRLRHPARTHSPCRSRRQPAIASPSRPASDASTTSATPPNPWKRVSLGGALEVAEPLPLLGAHRNVSRISGPSPT